MRKALILVGMFLISFTLVACGDDTTKVTPPTFNSINVDGVSPIVDGELVTFYKGKNEPILIQVNINNPDGLFISSIKIDGYSYFASRFTDASTGNTIYFEMSAGTTLGEKVSSVTDIVYKDGDISKSVLVETNNKFIKYVYKTLPTVERESYTVEEDFIYVNFDILDIDDVITNNTLIAELYSGETLVKSIIFQEGQTDVLFSSLLSNKNYDIKVKANFDLDDNEGYKTEVVLYSGPFSTLDNSIPSASIINPVVTSNSIVFDVTYKDDDNVTLPDGITVGVFRNGIMVGYVDLTGSTTGVSIGGLLNDNEYTLKVLSDYDLLDGHSTITDAVLTAHTFSTLPREVPEPTISGLNIEENRILFDFSIYDPDELIYKDTLVAKLYVEGVLKEAVAVNEYSADFQIFNLFANDNFVIEIEASYNLNDGLGIQENMVIYSQEFTTYENDVPSVVVEDLVVTQGYVTVTLEVFDDDDTLDGALVARLYEIYFDGDTEIEVEVGTIQFNDDATELVFPYLTSYLRGYRVDIEADYDLRDGSIPKEDEILFRSLLLSSERKAPAAELNDIVFGTEQIEINVNVMDSDDTVATDTVIVYLYLNGVEIDSIILSVGENLVTFTGLLSNNEYEVIVKANYTYDLIDQSVLLINQELVSSAIYTLEKEIASAVISEVYSFTESIVFDVTVSDDYLSLIVPSLNAVLYLDGVDTGLFEPLVIGGNYAITFDGLLSNENYEIRIISDYDLNDGNGSTSDYEMAVEFVRTVVKDIPLATFINIEADQDTIVFDVAIIDNDLVILTNPIAMLYIDDNYTGESVVLNIGLNSNVTFITVLSSERYNVRIVADYDLNDGKPVVVDEELSFSFVNTTAKDNIQAAFVEVTNGHDTIEFSVGVIDEDLVGSNIKAVIYIGETYIDEIALTVGDNTGLIFNSLLSGQAYIIKIEADYNLNEGGGIVTGTVFDIYYTNTDALNIPTSIISNISRDKSSITMNILVSDTDSTSTGTFKAVLYKDDVATGAEEVLSLGVNLDISFTGLLSNNEYEVRVVTDYDINDGIGVIADVVLSNQLITTEAYLIPVNTVSNLLITDSTVSFDFLYEDTDLVLTGGTVKTSLWVNGIKLSEKQVSGTSISFDISTMLANFDFVIKVTGDYDLHDGIGLVDDGSIVELELTTIANDTPSANIISTVVTQDSIDMTIEIDDDDTVSSSIKAVLYDKDDLMLEEITLTAGTNTISFSIIVDHLEMYEIKIVSDYNLLDGDGNHTSVELASNIVLLVNELVPEARITNTVVDITSITFDVEVLDNDLAIIGNLKAVLYKDGVPTASEIVLSVGDNLGESFTGLLSGHDYEVIVIVDYDNNNGNGTMSAFVLDLSEYTTVAKVAPTSTTTSITTDYTSITFDVNVLDDDSSITGNLKAVLYKDGVATASEIALTVGDNLGESFTGLLSGHTYEVKIITDYDLNDNTTVELSNLLETKAGTTVVKVAPTSIISNLSTDITSITFDVTVTDNDSSVTGNLKAVLYKDDVATGAEIALTVGDNLSESFTGLLSGHTYEVKVITDYDLNDGVSVELAFILDNEFGTTELKAIPTSTITNVVTENTTITFDVNVLDDDSTITGNLKAVLYEDGVATGAEIVLTVGDNLGETFTGLDFGVEYTIQIETDYNLNTGGADVTSSVLATETASTVAIIIMSDIVPGKETHNFILDIDDQFSILSGFVVEVRVFDEGDLLVGDVYFVTEPTDFDLLNLWSDYDYYIQVTASYDVGNGIVTEIVYTYEFHTEAKEIPAVLISELDVSNATDIVFDVTGTADVDSIILGSFEAVLFVNGVETATLVVSGDGTYTFLGHDGTDGNDYAIVVRATVDINDGVGTITEYELYVKSWIYADKN